MAASDLFYLLAQSTITSLAGIYMFKVNDKNSRTRCEICSELTIKTPERRKWRRSGVLIVKFEQVIADWIPVPLSYNHIVF